MKLLFLYVVYIIALLYHTQADYISENVLENLLGMYS